MISIVITAYKEPKTIGKAIQSIISQNIKDNYELIISSPDYPTINIAKNYKSNNKNIKIFQDPGKGKTEALNLLIPNLKGEIIILTDGDVFVDNNSINKIIKAFQDKSVGCVTGRPLSLNNRKNLYGYWSHLLCNAAHNLRLKRNQKNQFLECSGYLWAFRNNIIRKIPKDTAEDSIVPCIFYTKKYKIKYIPDAKVYVKFPNNLYDFIDQKKRTAKAHETLGKYINIKNIPRMKSLKNEILGSFQVFKYPRNLLEFIYTLLLFPLRFYIWVLVFYKRYLKNDLKVDGWHATKSTK